jgi:hypothetical protein
MRIKSILMCGVLLALAGAAAAQTKFSGTQQCAKPDPEYTVPVGDRPDHVMSLSKEKCTWTQGEMAGSQLKEEDDTFVSDITGNVSRDKGFGVGVLASGDKYSGHFEGTTTIKDKAPVSAQGTFTFTGGTGKLKGIKGKCTFTGKFSPDGTSTFQIEGEYTLAAAKSGK